MKSKGIDLFSLPFLFPIVTVGLAILTSILLGMFGPAAAVVIGMVIMMTAILMYRWDELAVTLILIIHLYVDWYLGFAFIALCITLVFLFFLFLRNSYHEHKIAPRALWLWAIFLVLGIFPALRGITLIDSAYYYFNIIFYALLMYWLGLLISKDTTHLTHLFKLLTLFGVLLALHTIIEATTGTMLFKSTRYDAYLDMLGGYTINGMANRASSFLINPDSTGTFFALMLFPPLCLGVKCPSLSGKIGYLAGILLILLALLFTYSTGAWLAACVGVVTFIVFVGYNRYRVLIPLVLCAVFMILVVAFPFEIRLLQVHASDPAGIALRSGAWQTGLRVIEAFPLTGLGLGRYVYIERANPFRVQAQYIPLYHPHNSYLELAALGGIPLLVVFLLIVVVCLWLAVHRWMQADRSERALLAGGLALVVTLSFNSLSNPSWTLAPLAAIGWLILGVISAPPVVKSISHIIPKDIPDDTTVRSKHSTAQWNTSAPTRSRLILQPFPLNEPPLTGGRDTRNTYSTQFEHLNEHIDQWPPFVNLEANSSPNSAYIDFIIQQETMIIPVLRDTVTKAEAWSGSSERIISIVRNLARNSGIYSLASLASPLIALVLGPLLTHSLSRTEYGALSVLNTAIVLLAAITQLGIGSAFFRAYNHDYELERDKRAVVSTVTMLLCLSSTLPTISCYLGAPWLATLLFHDVSLAIAVRITAGIVFLQNMTVPIFSWLRAENRPAKFVSLAIVNLVISLGATILLVGVIHMGITGALLATACGYAAIVLGTLPVLLAGSGLQWRADIAWNILSFGLPSVSSLVAVWILQLSDRYLLSLFGSLAETASYSVAYTLGGALAPVAIAPFSLAWYSMIYTIAKREDARQVFQHIFRWYSMVLLCAVFAFSLLATSILHMFFPPSYQATELVIPVVAVSTMFYGIYNIFAVGTYIQRKTWLGSVYTAITAIVNVGLNIVLIPLYGAMGAAIATLLAYILLAVMSYLINQRLYHVSFETGKFSVALLLGVVCYVGSSILARTQGMYAALAVMCGGMMLYTLCLLYIGKFPVKKLLWGTRQWHRL